MAYPFPIEQEELLISCTVMAIRTQLDFISLKDLTEFLGCYNYILPSKRTLAFSFIEYLTANCFTMEPKAKDLFNAWLLADMIQCLLTEEQQDEVVLRLTGKNMD